MFLEENPEEYLETLQKKYEKDGAIVYLLLIVQVKIVAERLANISLDKVTLKKIQLLSEYLNNVDDCFFELTTYTNRLGIFGSNFRIFNYKDILNCFRHFKRSPKHQHAMIQFLIHSIILVFSE